MLTAWLKEAADQAASLSNTDPAHVTNTAERFVYILVRPQGLEVVARDSEKHVRHVIFFDELEAIRFNPLPDLVRKMVSKLEALT